MNCTHIQPERWLTLGAMNGVGSSLRWVRDTFGQTERLAEAAGLDTYDLLTAQARLAPPGSKGLLFLPYLSGERTPIWDPYARGVFLGVTLGHTRADFLRAVLEGPAMAIRQVVEMLEVDCHLPVQAMRVGGAAAASPVWMQIIADVLGKPIISLTTVHTEVSEPHSWQDWVWDFTLRWRRWRRPRRRPASGLSPIHALTQRTRNCSPSTRAYILTSSQISNVLPASTCRRSG